MNKVAVVHAAESYGAEQTSIRMPSLSVVGEASYPRFKPMLPLHEREEGERED